TASTLRMVNCARVVKGYIGYGEESDTPLFRHVSIRALTAHVHGDRADVRVRELLSYESSDPRRAHVTIDDSIHLIWRDGRWQVAKPGAIYYASQSAYQWPPTVLDPPVLQAEAAAPAPRREQPPACHGPQLAAWSDPTGDAPSPVDLTG